MTAINNTDSSNMNRGIELILRKKNLKKKTFLFVFEKVVFLFKKEITICLNFSFDIRKSQSKE
jgi:hypothetical protein